MVTNKLSTTEKKLRKMFRSNYNFKRDYILEDDYFSISTYQVLLDKFKVSAGSMKLQRELDKYTKNSDYDSKGIEAFIKDKKEKGIFKDDNDLIVDRISNTYNNDNVLDNDFEYIFVYDGNKYYAIIRIHTGTDIRGGYSDPVIFEYESDDMRDFLMNLTDVSVDTKKGNTYDTDDAGSHYYEAESGDTYTPEQVFNEGITNIYFRRL